MALPFLKTDKRDMSPARRDRSTPQPSPVSNQAPAPVAHMPPRRDRPAPTLTAIDGGAARDSDGKLGEELVRSRVEAINARQTGARPSGEIISVARYAKSMREKSRAAQYEKTKATVGRIEQIEIDLLIDMGAKTRARYISKLLEFGRTNKPLSLSASEEVKGLREQHEEISRGLDLLREALERGEIEIEGVEMI
jgi:hypothetical protein